MRQIKENDVGETTLEEYNKDCEYIFINWVSGELKGLTTREFKVSVEKISDEITEYLLFQKGLSYGKIP